MTEEKRAIEFEKRRSYLYEFLAGYKQNSGIFINNFFRNRDFKTYCEDKFHGFDFDVSGFFPNLFDDMTISFEMVRYLGQLEDMGIAYYPITPEFIARLIAVAEVFDILKPLEEDTILYRGCSTLERNGVNGLVSTTTDRKIAEQFSRGTILKIHVPKGTKYLDVKSIRPKEQRSRDRENEVLLPPCEYQILSCGKIKSRNEPNNLKGTTNLIEMTVTPLDLLEEFLKMIENPPEEYLPIRDVQGDTYYDSISMLKNYIEKRNANNNVLRKNKNNISKKTYI